MTQHRTSLPERQPTGRRARWERYRITHPFSAKDQAGLWAAILGTVGLAVLLGWALEIRGGTVIVLALPVIVSWFENRRTVFQFDAAGVRIGDVLLRWNDVTHFVVATPPGDRYALIGARLSPGVTLPTGVAVPPQHPAMPAPIHVAVLRSKFDLATMVSKARKYAAPHVRIVVADPSGERITGQ